ncbi:MAG: helix-turn-helix domain-containing protein [Eubacteriales bacterium]|nr:helix-turn-helix domain-containing protein [Eubacteriales bacterium]
MITYKPFRNTLKNSNESRYTLIKDHHISSSMLDKIRKEEVLNTTAINDLCWFLLCSVSELMEYFPSNNDQIL